MTSTPDDPRASERLSELRQAELSRTLKQSDFLRAVLGGAPVHELEQIKAELDALTEQASAALAQVLEDIRLTAPRMPESSPGRR